MHTLNCDIKRDGLNAVVRLTGELDTATQNLLIGIATPCIIRGATLTLDCAGITFMDSRGLQAMLELRRITLRTGAVLTLASPPRAVRRILVLAGVAALFTTTGVPSGMPDLASRSDDRRF
jgi:anti-sigma B factor antagonist